MGEIIGCNAIFAFARHCSSRFDARKVDLWSLGCIMHLLLRGVLPFDGHTKDEVVEKTLNKSLNLTHKKFECVSDAAKDLISKLLIKNPKKRISIENALKHEWFDSLKSKITEQNDWKIHSNISAEMQAVMSGADDTPLPLNAKQQQALIEA